VKSGNRRYSRAIRLRLRFISPEPSRRYSSISRAEVPGNRTTSSGRPAIMPSFSLMGPAHPMECGSIRVAPVSGTSRRRLAAVVAIQSILDPGERFEAWRDALNSASVEEEKHAALRSLMSFEKPWSEMLPILQRQIASSDTATRTFIFDPVAYEIRHRRWPNAIKPADFPCERLERETDKGLIERYLGSFGLLLEFAGEEEPGDVGRLLRERLALCLRRLCLVAGEEAAQACEDLRTRYAR